MIETGQQNLKTLKQCRQRGEIEPFVIFFFREGLRGLFKQHMLSSTRYAL